MIKRQNQRLKINRMKGILTLITHQPAGVIRLSLPEMETIQED